MSRGVSQALIRIEELKKMGVEMVIETRKIFHEAKAGLQDKGDVVIHLKPGPEGSGIQLDIKSKVMALFGSQIRASVLEEIAAYGLTDLIVLVHDEGALDYAIRARVQTAIERALREEQPWNA
jgi:citrate lyase subunit gamma (acyl carrier protein)